MAAAPKPPTLLAAVKAWEGLLFTCGVVRSPREHIKDKIATLLCRQFPFKTLLGEIRDHTPVS